MAIYHLTMKNISRTGRNTIASLAYRAGVKLTDPKTGDTFDYSDKNVSGVELHIAEDAPAWAKELQELINEKKQAGVQQLSDLAEGAETCI